MNVQRFAATCCICLLGTLAFSGFAADNMITNDPNFGVKIDAWVEGTISKIEASSNKFTVHGLQRPYATQYAKMLKEINTKTANMNAVDRDKKIAEIRSSWASTLNKAAIPESTTPSDFNFKVAEKDGMFLAYADSRAPHDVSNASASFGDESHQSMHSINDFKVGDYVVVGYESGIVNNEVYVIGNIVKPSMSSVNAQYRNDAPTTVTSSKLDLETEQTRQIRRALVEDKSLSTSAQNVNIEVKDGIAHLRGSVPTQAEKSEVETKASSVMGNSGKIMSHLEVSK